MDFDKIKSSEELKSHLNMAYLITKSNNLYHYTSLNSLYQIFKNKSIRFSRLSVMNDVMERDFANGCEDYFFCLSKEPYGKECFGMWAMYGKLIKNSNSITAENLGVKIQFPRSVIENLRNESLLSFHAISYIARDSGNLFLGTMTNKNKFTIDKTDLSGYVKDVCWKYENEYRLRKKTNKNKTEEYFSVPISDTLLKELCVYPSPVSNVEVCKKMFSELEKKYGRTSVEPVFKKNLYEGMYSFN